MVNAKFRLSDFMQGFPKDDKCGNTHGCWGDCDGSCSFLLTWKTSSEGLGVDFTIKAVLSSTDDQWVGFGISQSPTMDLTKVYNFGKLISLIRRLLHACTGDDQFLDTLLEAVSELQILYRKYEDYFNICGYQVEDNKTSTPSRKSKSSVNNLSTPKDRVLQHGKSIDSRFTEIHTILSTIDNSIKSFVNMLSDLKHSTDHVPNNMQSMITEIVSTNKKKIMENLVLIETKMKHSSQSLDSLHTKSNLIDSQLKKMDTAHNESKNLLSNLTSLVINLQDRVDQLENKLSEPLHEGKCNTQNDQQLQHPSLNNTTELETETPTKPQIGINFVTKDKRPTQIISDRQNAEEPNRDVPKINCDYLILSDSILRRIQPNRFTPKQKTVKRYIRGGANTCTSFIEKNGTTINAKNILIHIGTRDLQSEGVKEEEFGNLLEIASKTWNSSKFSSCQ
ncbi:unnamed protein product [Mytilus edulis]|uniref:Uncharacterized protein n=1 Tax=Mytilus edulis TaxID=6550 RepID=A0A8S3R2M9_MYTED|nr:unnamed protein product [Mytilus edulis]